LKSFSPHRITHASTLTPPPAPTGPSSVPRARPASAASAPLPACLLPDALPACAACVVAACRSSSWCSSCSSLQACMPMRHLLSALSLCRTSCRIMVVAPAGVRRVDQAGVSQRWPAVQASPRACTQRLASSVQRAAEGSFAGWANASKHAGQGHGQAHLSARWAVYRLYIGCI